MKKAFVVLAIVALVAAFNVMAAIEGGPHDLTASGTGAIANRSANIGEICGFCHVPHNGNNATLPLWNHTASGQVFVPYASPTNTLNAVVGAPGAGSLQCLGCHDGTTGLGSVTTSGGQMFTTTNTKAAPDNAAVGMTGARALGTDLSNDHPIGFLYNNALFLADGQLVDPVDAAGSGLAPARLIGGRVECSSCHSMHRPVVATNILIDGMNDSDLCLNCHIK